MTNTEQWTVIDGATDYSADMLDAYIQGNLTPEQQAEFEAYMMDKPEMLEQAEYGLLMREGFIANEVAERPLARRRQPWQLAAAAVLSVGIGTLIGFSLGGGQSAPLLVASNQLLASQIVNLPVTRSQAPEHTEVTVSAEAQLVVLRIPLPIPESTRYQVVVADENGPIGSPLVSEPAGAGVLNVALDATSLQTGTYVVSVSLPDAQTGATVAVPITLRVVVPQ